MWCPKDDTRPCLRGQGLLANDPAYGREAGSIRLWDTLVLQEMGSILGIVVWDRCCRGSLEALHLWVLLGRHRLSMDFRIQGHSAFEIDPRPRGIWTDV